MSGAVSVNWLTVIGLIYTGIGIALASTAMVGAAQMAGASQVARKRAARMQGAYITWGAVIALAGLFLQAVAQVHVLAFGPIVAGLMMALLGLLAVFGVCRIGDMGASFGEAPATETTAVAPAGTVELPRPALAVNQVKLVSAG